MTASYNIDRDRRNETRLEGFFPVRVRGVKEDGQLFEINTLADNISQGGLYLQIPHALHAGMSLFTLTRLPGGASLAAQGRIVREETKSQGLTGIAVCFSRRRLIPTQTVN